MGHNFNIITNHLIIGNFEKMHREKHVKSTETVQCAPHLNIYFIPEFTFLATS